MFNLPHYVGLDYHQKIVAAVTNRWVRKLIHQVTDLKPSNDATVDFSRSGQKSTKRKTPPDAGADSRRTPESSVQDVLL